MLADGLRIPLVLGNIAVLPRRGVAVNGTIRRHHVLGPDAEVPPECCRDRG